MMTDQHAPLTQEKQGAPAPADSSFEEQALSHPVVQQALRLFGGRVVSVRRLPSPTSAGQAPEQQPLW